MHGENTELIIVTYRRYRALLDVSSAVVEQPTVEAVLNSLRGVLSNISVLHGADLYLLNDDGSTLQLYAFDRGPDEPPIGIGTRLPRTDTVSRVMDEQQPIYIPDLSQEMVKYAELTPFASRVHGRSSYLFPVSTSRKQYGILAFTNAQGQEFPPEDVELMGSIASHVAVAVETVLATARAASYQRELARERDRLRLVLEINNHVITKLDTNDLLRFAGTSIRSYFGSDVTGCWILEKGSNKLQSVLLDFRDAKEVPAEIASADLTDNDYEKLRARRAEIWSIEDFPKLPAGIAEALKAELISSFAIAPLATVGGSLGLLAMGSMKANAFRQEDLDLLSQIGIQI